MDHVQVRFPTNVEDVARVIYDMTRKLYLLSLPLILIHLLLLHRSGVPTDIGQSLDTTELPSLPPILHYSTPAAPMTKYEMTTIIAKHLGLPINHVRPNTEPPTGAAAAQRPENSQLSTKELEEIGVDSGEQEGFDNWWKVYCKDLRGV
jgi:S-adenosylmethionine synthetase